MTHQIQLAKSEWARQTLPILRLRQLSFMLQTMTHRIQLAKQIKECAQLSGSFTLRSGITSDIYFDKYQFESNPQILKSIAEEMAGLVPTETDVLAGLEMGGIPVVTLLSQIMGLPAAFIRKAAKSYGTCKYAEGPELQGKNVTLIEDVVSSGGAILDALEKLRADQIEPIGVVCVIDRQSGGYERLRSVGMKLRSVFKMQEILDVT